MMMQTNRARGVTRLAGAFAGLALLTACDVKNELLQPQNPGIVDQSAVGSPAAAAALKIGAMGRLKWVVSDPGVSGFAGSSIWEAAALMTDEFMNSDFQNSQNDLDARTISPDNSATNYTHTTQARGYIRDAINAEQQFEPAKTADIGELYMAMGFIEMTLAENFCNGIPLGTNTAGVVDYSLPDFKPRTNAEVYVLALAHLDSALTILGSASDVSSTVVRQATLITKARVLVDQGQFAAAAALVPASVAPTTYQYAFVTQASSNGDDLGFWTLNNSIGRYSVGDSSVVFASKTFTTLNAIPFASMKDPRVPVITGASLGLQAEDGATPFFIQQVYKGRDDPIPMVSGLDARLIEAEAKLNAADYAGMMTILNGLRTAPPKIGNFQPATMTAIATTPATKDAAIDLFFREKALWQFARGYRLSDLRRLVRQYNRSQDKVFPAGQQYKGVVYGSDVNFPVPDAERVNPQFSGCIDRKA
jgi:starch-binding outer membrane protein, SusD/RagB family